MNQNDKIDRLLTHFESDPTIGHIGIGERLEAIDKRVSAIELNQEKLKERNKIMYRMGVGITGIGTFIVGKSWNHIIIFFKSIP